MKPGGRINPISKKRRAQMPLREETRAAVLLRAKGQCEYRLAIREVECGFLPGRYQLEVDELRGGSWRNTEMVDPGACRLACPRHHQAKTEGFVFGGVFVGKREFVRRVLAYEAKHGGPG